MKVFPLFPIYPSKVSAVIQPLFVTSAEHPSSAATAETSFSILPSSAPLKRKNGGSLVQSQVPSSCNWSLLDSHTVVVVLSCPVVRKGTFFTPRLLGTGDCLAGKAKRCLPESRHCAERRKKKVANVCKKPKSVKVTLVSN